jgi:hypothetical protein
MYKRNAAKQLLQHYFRLLAEKADLRWDSDNDNEVGDIVDLIIEAAREGMQEKEEHSDSWHEYRKAYKDGE